MKLVHLSVASIAGCLVGLAVVVSIALHSYQGMRAKQAELVDLLALEKQIDGFSVASDSLLLFEPDPDLWRAYRAEGAAIQERLRDLGPEYPHADNAARHVGLIVEALERVLDGEAAPGGPPHGGPPAPLGLAPRSRVILNQVAGHGIALDSAFDEALGARQRAIAREATWIAATFAAAAGLFGALCVAAFGLIHRRISGPTRTLAGAIALIRDGDMSARARVGGSDELTELAREFNRLIEERQAVERRLAEQGEELRRREEHLSHYRQLIEGSEELYAIGDREYRYVLVNGAYAARLGRARADVEGRGVAEVLGRSHFETQVRPAMDRALAGEPQVFETRRTYPGIGERDLLVRYYPLASPDGAVHYAGAVITDITDLNLAHLELDRQRYLLELAGRVARLGGWSVDLASGTITWSDVVAEIHDMPHGHSPTLEEGIGFYAPEWRDTIGERFTACAERGEPYDEELEIITARGERRWVRTVGEPVKNARGEIIRVQGAFQDISVRKTAELDRQRQLERTRSILESITDAFYTVDGQWRFGYVNGAAEALLERPRDDLLGKNVWKAYPEAVGTRIERELRRAMREQVTVALEEYYPPLEKWLDIRAYPMDDGLAVYFRDTTERNRILARLREQEESLRSSRDELAQVLETRQALINSLPAHIALLDGNGDILDVNEQWRHFGAENESRDPGFGVGANYLAVCDNATGDCAEGAAEAAAGLRAVLAGQRERFSLEYPCHSPDTRRWFRVMANRLAMSEAAGTDYGAVVMHVDITERKLAEQELNRLAYQDSLTGLASRNGFVQRVGERLGAGGPGLDGLVVSLNVRGVHDINEAHGFDAGDRLLKQVGERLCASAGDGAVVGRAGGDDFVVFLPEARGAAPRRAEELAAAFSEPFDVGEGSRRVQAGARFGFTRAGGRRGVEEMLREAFLALSHARYDHTGVSSTAYTRQLDERARERVRINRELHRALERGELELHFQPKVVLETGRLVSCEALLRWRHPERGLMPPGAFIANAEQSKLIAPIGDWVVAEACQRLREWQDAGLQVVRVSVNVSLVQFMVGDFTATVRRALAAHAVAASSLSLEITESVFEEHSEQLLAQMNALHDMGVHLSLDDFGTGYSSLLYLQRYPFDEIKIDRGFVKDVVSDAYSRHIVATVLGVAAAIGAEVVAEGVETAAVRDKLVELGCRLGQGFFYSVPLETEDFRWLLEQRSALPLRAVQHQ